MKSLIGTFAAGPIAHNTRVDADTPPVWRTDLGRRIHQRRAGLRLTVQEVANAAEIAPTYLLHLERELSLPTMDTLIRLARVLDTTVADLLGWGHSFARIGYDGKPRPEAANRA
jgi:transcriptional regulator with XRE-family HTH domain